MTRVICNHVGAECTPQNCPCPHQGEHDPVFCGNIGSHCHEKPEYCPNVEADVICGEVETGGVGRGRFDARDEND